MTLPWLCRMSLLLSGLNILQPSSSIFYLCLSFLAAWYSTLGFLVLWEANFHRPNYDLVPLGEYIYLGGHIKLRTAIKTAGILLPVSLFCQIQCWWQENHFFSLFKLSSANTCIPLVTLCLCSTAHCYRGNVVWKLLFFPWILEPAEDGAGGICPAPALNFWWKLICWRNSVSQQCLSLVEQNIWS